MSVNTPVASLGVLLLDIGLVLLFIIVAGDIRENIKPVLSELLDRVKAEAIAKREIILN